MTNKNDTRRASSGTAALRFPARSISGRGLSGLCLTALCLSVLIAVPSFADVLVLEDGERIETQGPWEVKGSRIQFTDAKGALVSMRASSIDLEASRLANQPAASQKATPTATPQAPAPRRAPVLVLDNTTVRRARPSSIAAANGETEAEGTQAETEAALRVASYEEDRSFADGVRFSGVLENPSDNFAVLVSVRGVLRNTEGEESASAEGTLPAKSVGPGETQTFVVEFTDAWAYSTVDFEVTSKFLKSGRSTEATEASPEDSQDPAGTPNSSSEDSSDSPSKAPQA